MHAKGSLEVALPPTSSPLVPVNDTGFETSAEGLENLFLL